MESCHFLATWMELRGHYDKRSEPGTERQMLHILTLVEATEIDHIEVENRTEVTRS